eukprot:356154-Prymnesium_polylepis.2
MRTRAQPKPALACSTYALGPRAPHSAVSRPRVRVRGTSHACIHCESETFRSKRSIWGCLAKRPGEWATTARQARQVRCQWTSLLSFTISQPSGAVSVHDDRSMHTVTRITRRGKGNKEDSGLPSPTRDGSDADGRCSLPP